MMKTDTPFSANQADKLIFIFKVMSNYFYAMIFLAGSSLKILRRGLFLQLNFMALLYILKCSYTTNGSKILFGFIVFPKN